MHRADVAEVGVTLRQLRARLAHDLAADPTVPPLAKPGEIGGGHTGTRVAVRHSASLSSESAERIVRRLKRDHREIAVSRGRQERRDEKIRRNCEFKSNAVNPSPWSIVGTAMVRLQCEKVAAETV